MEPVVTPEEMGAIDAEAPEPVEELIERAGWATARTAIAMLRQLPGHRAAGRRVVVLVGKGNNGADGRSAARFLQRRGVLCHVVDIAEPPDAVAPIPAQVDLVIDACFGTGLRGEFRSDRLPLEVADDTVPVLAVDIPSGVNGLTGQLQGRPLKADVTVTFAAVKPGLLLEPGRSLSGQVEVADIGLDCSRARLWHLSSQDLDLWPHRGPTAHKWDHAVAVIGGGRGMQGAPRLAASAALRAGAGYVLLASTGGAAPPSARQDPVEAVSVALVGDGTLGKEQLARCAAVVIGPGLSLDEETRELLRQLLSGLGVATVYDAGALQPDFLAATTGGSDSERPLPVLTPHDGEFARIVGRPAGPDRIADVRQAAVDLNAVVLLKGPTTVIAHPDGRALLSTAGDERLATAGTGDVLAGTIAAGLAGGLDPFLAAGLGAELHGRAAQLGAARGLVAGDLPPLIVEVLSGDRAPDRQPAATRMD